MRITVTGGAGYIGSHVVSLLIDHGFDVVVIDDLSTGFPERIPDVALVALDLANTQSRDELIHALAGCDAVIHFAGRKRVDESVERPSWYYQQNVGGMANLLLAMESASINNIVFSSSAAVYGSSEGQRIAEETPTKPINPYGNTKLIGERMLTDVAAQKEFNAASLRYFNVAGAGKPTLGDSAVLNLIPMVFERIDTNKAPLIFGADYPTRDGTCIRDFIHVADLADAHITALKKILSGSLTGHRVFNIGTGQGSSVREVIATIQAVSGITREPEIRNRRQGDPALVVGDPSRAHNELGWTSKRDLYEIVRSAWESHVLARK